MVQGSPSPPGRDQGRDKGQGQHGQQGRNGREQHDKEQHEAG